MAGHVAKQGYMKRYSKSLLSGGWKNTWVVLTQDSDLYLYKRQGDTEIKGKIHMRDVCKRFAYGEYTSGMPDRPAPPSGSSADLLLAIPQKNSSKAKIYWFCCYNNADLHEWMQAICNTLPTPQQQQQSSHQSHSQPVQATAAPQTSGAPPPYSTMPHAPYPGGGPGIGFDSMTGAPQGPGYPQPMPSGSTPYPQAPYPGQPAPYPGQPALYPQAPPPAQYAPQAYPQQAYQPPPQQYQQPYGYGPPPGAYGYQQPQQQVYYQQPQHKSKGFLSSNKGKLAAGVIGGAAAAYGAKKMFGGFGGFGLGRHGSWGSLSSASWGSGGSFGSFGSFD